MVQAATLLTISGLTIAAHYTGVDEHTGIFMSGIAIGVIPVLPVQYLRIDGDMTREVERDPALAWLKGLCRVSRAIGVRVITGQVESGNLRAAGVDYVQGYGIMRALPHDAPVHH